MSHQANLDRVFNPKVIAIVGDKGAAGYRWLKATSTVVDGKVYSVNIDPNEFEGIAAAGFQNFKSLVEIPEDVDYVVCSVPRNAAPYVVRDAIAKKVGGITVFTAGFSETNTDEGRDLEARITQMARESGLTMIGPNCMGIYVPGKGICFNHEQQYLGESGPVSVASQSGTHALNIAALLHANSVNVNKVVSFGNGVILESPDFLEYYKNDPSTELIVMYIEGVKDGRRLVRLLKETTRVKPVVIWKGGQTEAGARATRSHTASLAEPMHIWEAIFKQTGAIRVDGLEELVDVVQTLRYTAPGSGQRMGLMTMTGGQSVVTTDAFARVGLEVPILSDKSYEELSSFFDVVGGSYRNPIDMGQNWRAEESVLHVLEIMERDPNIDAVCLEFSVTFLTGRFQRNPEFFERFMKALDEFRRRHPLVIVLPPSHHEHELIDARRRFQDAGFAAFPSLSRAALAFKRFTDYHRFIDRSAR